MPDWMPTYDQAEVMPYHNIEKGKIVGIVFKYNFIMEKCRKLLIEQGITYPKLIISQGMFEDVREQYRTSKTLPEEILVDNGNYV